jgi:hypothetical protein
MIEICAPKGQERRPNGEVSGFPAEMSAFTTGAAEAFRSPRSSVAK